MFLPSAIVLCAIIDTVSNYYLAHCVTSNVTNSISMNLLKIDCMSRITKFIYHNKISTLSTRSSKYKIKRLKDVSSYQRSAAGL